MATPSKKAGDSSPRHSPHWFNPLETTWSPRRTPGHFNPLGNASETAEPAIVPGEAVTMITQNET
jgi:hypothetical protein